MLTQKTILINLDQNKIKQILIINNYFKNSII